MTRQLAVVALVLLSLVRLPTALCTVRLEVFEDSGCREGLVLFPLSLATPIQNPVSACFPLNGDNPADLFILRNSAASYDFQLQTWGAGSYNSDCSQSHEYPVQQDIVGSDLRPGTCNAYVVTDYDPYIGYPVASTAYSNFDYDLLNMPYDSSSSSTSHNTTAIVVGVVVPVVVIALCLLGCLAYRKYRGGQRSAKMDQPYAVGTQGVQMQHYQPQYSPQQPMSPLDGYASPSQHAAIAITEPALSRDVSVQHHASVSGLSRQYDDFRVSQPATGPVPYVMAAIPMMPTRPTGFSGADMGMAKPPGGAPAYQPQPYGQQTATVHEG